MSFFQRLVDATAAEQKALTAVPQLQDGLAGAISRASYIDYLTQAYHHVRHTVPLLKLARARLDHKPRLAAALDAYVEEETGHEQWILADIAAAGGDRERAAASAPNAATASMVRHAYDCVQHGNPVGLFGMVYVLEGTSVATGHARRAGDCRESWLASRGVHLPDIARRTGPGAHALLCRPDERALMTRSTSRPLSTWRATCSGCSRACSHPLKQESGMQRLDGKCVVLTGAAGGIGTLVAQRLRAQGAHVVGVDRVPCPAVQ